MDTYIHWDIEEEIKYSLSSVFMTICINSALMRFSSRFIHCNKTLARLLSVSAFLQTLSEGEEIKEEDLPDILVRLEIIETVEEAPGLLLEIDRWIDGATPKDPAGAIVVADKLGLQEVVERIATTGPEVEPTRIIASHNLNIRQLVNAWARGYSLGFDGCVDYPTDIRGFRKAVENGLPVKSLVLYPYLTNEILAMCKDLRELRIAHRSKTPVICPPCVETLVVKLACPVEIPENSSLKVLDASNNPFITFCPPGVTTLIAASRCGIPQELFPLSLEVLDVSDNEAVTKCPPSVKKLTAHGVASIDNLEECSNLTSLDVSYNVVMKVCSAGVVELDARSSVMTDISRCSKLERLNASNALFLRNCPDSVVEVDNSLGIISDFSHCQNLRKLFVNHHKRSIRLPSTLEHLEIRGPVTIENSCAFANLQTLDASDNPNITFCPLTVTKLIARGKCGISNLSNCRSLTYLDASDNSNIRECPPDVRYLLIRGNSGIKDISRCVDLSKLDISGNSAINSVMACRFLRVLIADSSVVKEVPPTLEVLSLENGTSSINLRECRRLTALNIRGNAAIKDYPSSVDYVLTGDSIGAVLVQSEAAHLFKF